MEKHSDKRFALLIDGDNIGSQYIKTILDEIANDGVVTYKRIYGDWTKPNLDSWKKVLLEYSITPMQQYAYTAGKNATDSAMIIDAMDILYSGKVDGFCLASSDSDFTRLAARLREAGMTVVGMGKKQTPRPFVSACTKFKYIDIISEEDKRSEPASRTAPAQRKTAAKKLTASAKKEESSQTPEAEIKSSIRKVIEESSGEDGWILASSVGDMLSKKYADFDPRNYGFKKLSALLDAWGFEIRQVQDPNSTGKPSGQIIYVRY